MSTAIKRTVFVSTFHHTVDEKKRLAIPAKWRAVASGAQKFFVFPLPGRYLFVLPESAMDRILEKVENIAMGEAERRSVLRMIAGKAHETSCDKQGRIVLTDELLRHAGITSATELVGVLKGFEIWSPAQLAKAESKMPVKSANWSKLLDI